LARRHHAALVLGPSGEGIVIFSGLQEDTDMYEVHGLNKKTLKFEMLGSELSKQELDLLLKQEQDNYYKLNISRLRYQ
jgi:hypothetical protein